MEHTVTILDLEFYLICYAFLGWVGETCYYAIAKRRFYNRGVLSMPLLLSYGVTYTLLILALPTLPESHFLRFLGTLAILSVVERLADAILRRVGPGLHWGEERPRLFTGSGRGFITSLAVAGGIYTVYLVVHPWLIALGLLIPTLVKRAGVLVVLAVMAVDFVTVLYALRTGDLAGYERRQREGGQEKLAQRLEDTIWRRIQRSYPGIRDMTEEERGRYTFAKGLCLDKLVWVFLICALLGDGIETVYCRLVGGSWMSRSSVLYGPFSFVWGLGAVVLTVTLQGLGEKNDRYVFLGGFIVGGAYEYLCSLFTELVFGTVFWDYSHMPLNIGGRTNVLFCFFWGALAVVWVKILYPPLSRFIERLPALTGKVLTYVVVLAMVCNAALTSAAMVRFGTRPGRPESVNAFEAFLDRNYDDEFMAHRWPNMVVTGEG